ncbi:MAG TPA: exodeoxyribonuclease VII small subunit [Pseudonocardiaceae bacterium]|jgi:exodeoxyribonuclease VII small subunit|nr:exodeoxyribonuclease VII small subunit [Pseudonocardiaceae bacterium]
MTDQDRDQHSSDQQAGELAAVGYEAARDELMQVVRTLEAGGLSLDDSLALWERGEALARICERHLAGARQRVESALARVEAVETAPADERS